MIDALLPAAKDPAKLKFRTLWNNVTIGAVTLSGFFRSSVTGTDGLTGFNCVTDIQGFFGSFAVLEIQYFPENGTLTAGTLSTQLEATFQASTITSMANAQDLVFDYKNRLTTPGSASYPQEWLSIYRPGNSSRSDVEEIYESFECVLPTDLATRLTLPSNNYYALWDWKTDGYFYNGGYGYGDLRLIVTIFKWSVDGRLYWNVGIDDNANGRSVIPSLSPSLQTYQSQRFDDTKIPLGVPFKFEVYMKRPRKINVRSTSTENGIVNPTNPNQYRYEQDLETGIFKCGITILSTGEFIPLGNFKGGRMMGAENLPFGRCMRGMYTPGTPPMNFAFTDWQVWDSIPAHSKLRSM